MRLGLFSLLIAVSLSANLLAQTSGWAPPPGHVTLSLWSSTAPGNEINATTAKDNVIAGKPVIRLGNVSTPTLTVYSPKGKNTARQWSCFREALTASWLSIWKVPKSAIGSTRSASPAFW